MYKAAVIGASGYVGIELVRWLLGHPELRCVMATSDSECGEPLSALYPALAGATETRLVAHSDAIEAAPGSIDLAFLAVPHTSAMAIAPALLDAGISVVDMSADFRLRDAAEYEEWYGQRHSAPELLPKAVYGLAEANRAQLEAAGWKRAADGTPALVANPGCYPTASGLAVYPALRSGLYGEGAVVVNAISGVSGAGRKATATTHFCSATADLAAYGATTHRHTPEIAQSLCSFAGRPVPVSFTPHLAPLIRGMVATAYIPLAASASEASCIEAYKQAYQDEEFVHMLPAGAMPHSAHVAGTNNAHVGIAYDGRNHALLASCAIDNLGKGAASQAVQCANIILGIDESSGLRGSAAVV